MKKLIVSILLCLSLFSCKKGLHEYEQIFLHSYIVGYIDGTIVVKPYIISDKTQLLLTIYWDKSEYYPSPDFGYTNEHIDRFLQISECNGDQTYNREEMWGPGSGAGRQCLSDNFQSIEVVCTNTAWDEKHPANASLNDLAAIEYRSLAHYIRSRYTDFGETHIEKPLMELKQTDLAMIDPSINLSFDTFPQPGTYNLQVTLTTTEGAEKTATCTVEIE